MSGVVFSWTVWDKSSTVKWRAGDDEVQVQLQLAPVCIAFLAHLDVVAICGAPAEFGARNLHFYSAAGDFLKSFDAPAYGDDPHFSGIEDRGPADVHVNFSFQDDKGHWQEHSGELNTDTGAITNEHRAY